MSQRLVDTIDILSRLVGFETISGRPTRAIVDYITNPTKKRDDYPEMPPQNYLSEEVRMAAAEFMLEIKK